MEGSTASVPGVSRARLSREVVQLHARMYGRGPTKAQSFITDTYALCVVQEVLTRGERTMIENGYGDRVREGRQTFFEIARPEMISIVEGLTARSVTGAFSQFDPTLDTEVFVFLFEPDGNGNGNGSMAVESGQ